MKKQIFQILSVFILTVSAWGCNSSPTVPIPPPTATQVTTTSPDNMGNILITGEPDTARWGDLIIVYNDSTGAGIVEEAEEDGSFEVELQADEMDVIVVQIKRGDDLSEEFVVTVE